MMWRTVYSTLSPGGAGARLSVLIFHRVLAVADPLSPDTIDAALFDRICGWLARWFRVLPLEESVHALRAGRLPARAAAITFDDGYADNHDQAWPILRRHGLPATFFIATGFLDGGRMWNDTVIEAVRHAPGARLDLRHLGLKDIELLDVSSGPDKLLALQQLIAAIKYLPPARRDAVVQALADEVGVARLPNDLMMRSDQVQAMRRDGAQIGAHTRTHPILARLPAEQALAELRGSRQTLESLLDEPVKVFAYPNGKPGADYGAESVRLVRESGFEVAVSTAWGSAGADVDPLQVPRFTPWDRTAMRYGLRLAGNLRREGVRASVEAGLPA